MSRPLRNNLADGWYHVYHRGLERRDLFRDDADREHFLELLSGVHDRFRLRLHAYCLMRNHWHGVVETPDANLSEAMQWLHLSYASWFNARHERVGPLFAGRFGSTPIEDGTWAYDVSLYVHLNPVCRNVFGLGKRVGKVAGKGLRAPSKEVATRRLKALREYRWSSYRGYAGYQNPPAWLESATLLARASRGGTRPAYRLDAQQLLTKGVDTRKREQLRDPIAIGSEAFIREVKRFAKGGRRETEARRKWRRRVAFDDVVRAIEAVRGESWSALCVRRGDPARPLAMWSARRYCGFTLRETGEHLGGMDYAAVGMALRRFEIKAAKSRELRSQMDSIGAMCDV